MTIIDQTESQTLSLEYRGLRNGGWWLELIDRDTGRARILMNPDKAFFDGVDIQRAEKLCKYLNPIKMYKGRDAVRKERATN